MHLKLFIILVSCFPSIFFASSINKKLVYIAPDMNIPFWQIMSKGISNASNSLGYDVEVYDSTNSTKKELQHTIKSIKDKVSGIIISPTTSSSCVTILKFAKKASIPVVVLDIGTDEGEYVSYISSNNREGAYKLGKVLAKKMKNIGYEDGKVGIVAISQKRLNGQERTAGFMKALKEEKIKSADIKQQVLWTQKETYDNVIEMILNYPDLKAVWIQTSHAYKAALSAIKNAGKMNDILLIAFDAEPIFLEDIPKGILLGTAMQQPYLMGQESIYAMNKYLNNKKVEKNIQLPILAISSDNIKDKLSLIKKNVLGIEDE